LLPIVDQGVEEAQENDEEVGFVSVSWDSPEVFHFVSFGAVDFNVSDFRLQVGEVDVENEHEHVNHVHESTESVLRTSKFLPLIIQHVLNNISFENVKFFALGNSLNDCTILLRDTGDNVKGVFHLENLLIFRLGLFLLLTNLKSLVTEPNRTENLWVLVPELENRSIIRSEHLLGVVVDGGPLIEVELVAKDFRVE
jgi:hypothetical protein